MPALRIGWHEVAMSSYILNLGLAMCLFCLFKSVLVILGKWTKLGLSGRLLGFLCLLILNLDVVCSP